jgi:hypothetical protein
VSDVWFDEAPRAQEKQKTTLDDIDLQATTIDLRRPEPLGPRRSEYSELAELAGMHGPRDVVSMLDEARRVGELLGDRAYYDFPAGQGRVTGATIDLMDALAIVWGRLVSRVEILDERRDRVFLRGRVIDLLALTAVERDYVSAISPAPGKFASKPDQADRWRVMQLQAASSKAIRGALEHALPVWLVDAALDSARTAAADAATGGKPLPEARNAALKYLGTFGVDRDLAAQIVGQPVDLWTSRELAELRTLSQELKRGEVSVEVLRSRVAGPTTETSTDRLAGLGLSEAPAPTPAPTTTATTAASSQAAATKPKAAADPVADAAHIRDAFATLGPAGAPVALSRLREAFRARAGLARVGDERWGAALLVGKDAGWLRIDGAAAILVSTSSTTRAPDDWDKRSGNDLVDMAQNLAIRLGDSVCAPIQAQLGLTDNDIAGDATEDQFRALGRALEQAERQLQAAAAAAESQS